MAFDFNDRSPESYYIHVFPFLKTFSFFDMFFFFFFNILPPFQDNFAASLMWNDVGVVRNPLIINAVY